MIEILIASHGLVLAEGLYVSKGGGGHTKSGIPIDVIRAKASLEQFVGRVALLREELSGAVKRDGGWTIVTDRVGEFGGDKSHGLFPRCLVITNFGMKPSSGEAR
jgi:hypothetical protein